VALSAHRERRRRSGSTPASTPTGADVSEYSVDDVVAASTDDEYDDDRARRLLAVEDAARAKRRGQAKRRFEKAARRENRIDALESRAAAASDADADDAADIDALSDAERSELEGLLRVRENFEEQYAPESFSEDHVEFKRMHNEAFVALARFCQRDRQRRTRTRTRRTTATAAGGDADGITEYDDDDEDPNVFYLDGPDMATSATLIDAHGFDPSRCYVANRHASTCGILRRRLPEENVLHATAAEALTPPDDNGDADDGSSGGGGSFSEIDFSAYYFDGCGGFAPHVVGMISAALVRRPQQKSSSLSPSSSSGRSVLERRRRRPPRTTAVGYSLMGGNRDVVEKELRICRALTAVARTRGMRARHVLDDPGRYGIPKEIRKTEGGTFTSWMLLEEDDDECVL